MLPALTSQSGGTDHELVALGNKIPASMMIQDL